MNNNIQLYASIIPVSKFYDDQTLVLQYDEPSDKLVIQSIIKKYMRRSQSFSNIDTWRYIEIYVNINDDVHIMRGKRWLRVVYECLKDNPDPSPINNRFDGATIIKISRTLNKDGVTLDMLIGGAK